MRNRATGRLGKEFGVEPGEDVGDLLDPSAAVEAVRAGDKEAFAAIVRRYESALVGYLYRLVGDREQALDLAQETFLEAYQGIIRTRAEISLPAWLYRIATNNAYDVLRRRRLIAWLRLKPQVAQDAPAEDPADRATERVMVERALAQLSQDDVTCLLLSNYVGFKHHEVAQILGIRPDAARQRIARAKDRFRKAYRSGAGPSDSYDLR